MKTENQVKLKREEANENFLQIKKIGPGSGGWNRMKGYIDALDWVLDNSG